MLPCSLGMVSKFFEFLDIDNANNTAHNVRLCRIVVAAGCLSAEDAVSLRAVEQVGTDTRQPQV